MTGQANPVLRLLLALALAAAGFLLSTGAAMAHGAHSAGHAAGHAQPAPVATSAATLSQDVIVEVARASEAARQPSDSCPNDPAGGHHGVDCCTVACHAALAIAALGPLPDSERCAQADGIVDRLDSRSGDRTERPPKRG